MNSLTESDIEERKTSFLLATALANGDWKTSKDPVQAAVHMLRAAELGHCLAAYKVAEMYLNGQGVNQDFDLATHWAQRVRELGSPEYSDFMLGSIDKKRNGGDRGDEIPYKTPSLPNRGFRFNFVEFLRSVMQLILGIVIFGSIGYCFNGNQDKEGSGLGEVPDQYRKR